MYAQKDILSYTRKLYCPVNAELTLISDRGTVLIVEYNGERFPVCRVDVGASKVEEDERLPNNQVSRTNPRKKSQPRNDRKSVVAVNQLGII